MSRQDTIAKAGREALDLLFDRFRHVAIGTVRDMAVSPERLLISRRAGLIEKTLLRREHKRPLRVAALRDLAFAPGNFFQRPAEVQRARGATFRGAPRYRRGERIINFENTGRMTKTLEPLPVTPGKSIGRDGGKLPAGGVE